MFDAPLHMASFDLAAVADFLSIVPQYIQSLKIILLINHNKHAVPAHCNLKQLMLPDACSVDEALEAVAKLLPQGKRLPESCLIAVSGAHLGTLQNHRPHPLREGDELVIIAPVAGG